MAEETTFFRGSPSLASRLGPLTVAVLLIAGGITAAILVKQNWLFLVAAAGLIYGAIVIVLVRNQVYEFTNERIRVSKGILTRRTDELELYRVKDTSLVEPMFLRMFSAGNIEITTVDASTPVLIAPALPGARAIREQLRQHIEDCRTRKQVRITELE